MSIGSVVSQSTPQLEKPSGAPALSPAAQLELAAQQAAPAGAPAIPPGADVPVNQLLVMLLQQMQGLQGTVGTLQAQLAEAREEVAVARAAAARAAKPAPAPSDTRQGQIPFYRRTDPTYVRNEATSKLMERATRDGLHCTINWNDMTLHVTVQGDPMKAQAFMAFAAKLPPYIY
jgi:hypothetical protein